MYFQDVKSSLSRAKSYLILIQQKFNTRSEVCGASMIQYYGDPLYLAEDMSHFIYRRTRYPLKYKGVNESTGIRPDIAREGRLGKINVYFKKYYYQTKKGWFVAVQTKNINPYLHNKFEFNYVIFDDMRFELVYPGQN